MRRGPGTALCPDLAADNGVFPTDILGRCTVIRHGPFIASLPLQPSSMGFLVRRWVFGCHFGARAAPATRCPVRQTQLVTLHLLSGCCIPLSGSPAELSPTCTHMQGSGASAGNPLSSSLVLGLAGQPASKENFQLVSLFSEAAWLRCWLSVALKPAWEWARLPHSSWVDSH